eukprot:scpid76188/ scgid2560/ Probable tubulin polyglutamylase TTLL9; Tubulin--tyrosine ligase-like protein 9
MAEQQAKVAAGTHGRGRARHLGQIRYKTALKNCIYDVLRTRPGWVEVKDDGAWDFYWCEVGWLRDNFDQNYFEEHVKICHFRNHYELTRKNLMVRNLKRYRKQLERVVGKDGQARMDFFPTTYELPSEYHMFVEEFKRNPGSIWIMKPISKSQGKGIFLFRKLKDIENWKKADYNSMYKDDRVAEARHEPETYIVSRYIANPYLISGKKFDLRVYALVTSYVPLKAWLYRSGFARFSGARYRLDTIEDSYVHLTNVAIQKTAPDYDPEKGCKWGLQELRNFFVAKHGQDAADTLYREIDNVLIRSLESVQKIIINDKHCFEVYGFDIMIDANLKPWLIEVNASPSLTASSPSDHELKVGLLTDMLDIIDMEGKLSGDETRIGGFDLMWNEGPVHSQEICLKETVPDYPTNTFLGCENDRETQRADLHRSLAMAKILARKKKSSQ